MFQKQHIGILQVQMGFEGLRKLSLIIFFCKFDVFLYLFPDYTLNERLNKQKLDNF